MRRDVGRDPLGHLSHRVDEVLHAHHAAQLLLEHRSGRVRDVHHDLGAKRRVRRSEAGLHVVDQPLVPLERVDKIAGALEEFLLRHRRGLADVGRRVVEVLLEEREEAGDEGRDVGRLLDQRAQVGDAHCRLLHQLVVCVFDTADDDRHHEGERRAVHRITESGEHHLLDARHRRVRLHQREQQVVLERRRHLRILHTLAQLGQRLLRRALHLGVRVIQTLHHERDALREARAHRARRAEGQQRGEAETLDLHAPSATHHLHALVQRADH
mmetsp:Transcript_14917/g.37201  ORF Transcript_14917/g.37201 Transcript_14917/m.37201 type:complete len:270 (+) Transcript_14917:1104-1913(+)